MLEIRHGGLQGGHVGPFADYPEAIRAAVNYVNGTPLYRATMETITPYGKNEVISIQFIRSPHACNCDLCPIAGESFLHVRALRTAGF